MEELKAKLIELGVPAGHLNIDAKGGMFINCVDTQYVKKEGNVYKFHSVGGSRFCWLQEFVSAEECADFVAKNIFFKTNEEINKEYRKIAAALKGGF